MKKSLLVVLAFALCFALPVFAQDEGGEMAMMGPPPALDNAFLKSYVGVWEGKSEGAMGSSDDKLTYQIGMDGQFLMMEMQSSSEMGMMKGMGALTLQGDKVVGYWIDNMRTMAAGEGTIEGNKLTISWTGMNGMKYHSVEEMVDENTLKGTAKMEMPDGTVMESTSVYTRAKEMTDKM